MLEASGVLNDMQNQIVAYQNKIYRYEEMAASAQQPNPYLVTKRQISVDTSMVQFNRADMLDVAAALRNYSERVYHHIKTINEKKNSIAAVWRDSQYDDFAEFISEVTKNVVNAIKLFEDYVIYLEGKIKELS
jgi:conjugal transfer/entry exclusion protein